MITGDIERNNALADLSEEDLKFTLERKKKMYETMPADVSKSINVKALYDLLEIYKLKETMLHAALRCDPLHEGVGATNAESFRTKSRVRRTLGVLRKVARNVLHPYDDYTLSDNVAKEDMWESHLIFQKATATYADYTNVILQRLSEIHKTLTRLCQFMETIIFTRLDAETILRISGYVESCRLMTDEVQGTLRMLSGFST